MDRLREMEMFVRVVEAGSFSAAARDLKMGQPAVSKTIASLEDRLGVRLLTRSTRKLSLTEAGTAFFDRALRSINPDAGVITETATEIEIDCVDRFQERVDRLGYCSGRGITVMHTGYTSAPTIELTWALILASARHIPSEAASVHCG